MLHPQFVLVLSGGSAGQVLSKISSADGDYEWSTPSGGGGSPGGSDTQIQYNNAGVFAGSANLVYDGTKIASNVKIEASNASGTFFDTGTGTFKAGDLTPSGTSTQFLLNDSTGTIELFANTFLRLRSYGGIVTIGDVDGDGNSTKLIVDDTNSRATFSKKFVVTDSGDYYAYDTGTATYWKWASVNGVWTGTDTGSGSLP